MIQENKDRNVVAIVVAVVWQTCQPRYVFLVRIEEGAGVLRGWVGGVRYGKRVSLRFSGSIPVPCQQRLRNLWEVHG